LVGSITIGGRNLLGVGDGLLQVDIELEGFSNYITLLLAVVGDENITPERENALLGWYLQEQVNVVRYFHKLGQGWSANMAWYVPSKSIMLKLM
jgi:hypothetical protein